MQVQTVLDDPVAHRVVIDAVVVGLPATQGLLAQHVIGQTELTLCRALERTQVSHVDARSHERTRSSRDLEVGLVEELPALGQQPVGDEVAERAGVDVRCVLQLDRGQPKGASCVVIGVQVRRR